MRASGGSTLPISGRQLASALIRLVAIGAVVVLAVVEIPGLGAIRPRLGGADIGWMALAAALELGSVFAFALVLHATFARHLGGDGRRVRALPRSGRAGDRGSSPLPGGRLIDPARSGRD